MVKRKRYASKKQNKGWWVLAGILIIAGITLIGMNFSVVSTGNSFSWIEDESSDVFKIGSFSFSSTGPQYFGSGDYSDSDDYPGDWQVKAFWNGKEYVLRSGVETGLNDYLQVTARIDAELTDGVLDEGWDVTYRFKVVDDDFLESRILESSLGYKKDSSASVQLVVSNRFANLDSESFGYYTSTTYELTGRSVKGEVQAVSNMGDSLINVDLPTSSYGFVTVKVTPFVRFGGQEWGFETQTVRYEVSDNADVVVPNCPQVYEPVVGSDGTLYSNQCMADFYDAESVRQATEEELRSISGSSGGWLNTVLIVFGIFMLVAGAFLFYVSEKGWGTVALILAVVAIGSSFTFFSIVTPYDNYVLYGESSTGFENLTETYSRQVGSDRVYATQEGSYWGISSFHDSDVGCSSALTGSDTNPTLIVDRCGDASIFTTQDLIGDDLKGTLRCSLKSGGYCSIGVFESYTQGTRLIYQNSQEIYRIDQYGRSGATVTTKIGVDLEKSPTYEGIYRLFINGEYVKDVNLAGYAEAGVWTYAQTTSSGYYPGRAEAEWKNLRQDLFGCSVESDELEVAFTVFSGSSLSIQSFPYGVERFCPDHKSRIRYYDENRTRDDESNEIIQRLANGETLAVPDNEAWTVFFVTKNTGSLPDGPVCEFDEARDLSSGECVPMAGVAHQCYVDTDCFVPDNCEGVTASCLSNEQCRYSSTECISQYLTNNIFVYGCVDDSDCEGVGGECKAAGENSERYDFICFQSETVFIETNVTVEKEVEKVVEREVFNDTLIFGAGSVMLIIGVLAGLLIMHNSRKRGGRK